MPAVESAWDVKGRCKLQSWNISDVLQAGKDTVIESKELSDPDLNKKIWALINLKYVLKTDFFCHLVQWQSK